MSRGWRWAFVVMIPINALMFALAVTHAMPLRALEKLAWVAFFSYLIARTDRKGEWRGMEANAR